MNTGPELAEKLERACRSTLTQELGNAMMFGPIHVEELPREAETSIRVSICYQESLKAQGGNMVTRALKAVKARMDAIVPDRSVDVKLLTEEGFRDFMTGHDEPEARPFTGQGDAG